MRVAVPCAAVLALLAVSAAAAAAPSFRFDQVLSNADGSVQYVMLRETDGANGQDGFAGLTLTATQGTRVITFTFPANLPSTTTARRTVLVASAGYVARAATEPEFAAVQPDYVIPDRFLPTAAGTVTFAGVDTLAYDALPGDGFSAVYSTGEVKDSAVQNFKGATTRLPLLRGYLDGVCRFYIPAEHGNSHFFSALPAECATVAALATTNPNYSGYVEETAAAFFVATPFPDGACAYKWTPVYRLWNQRADSNHRYTIDPAIKAQMIARGYVAEGVGADAVAMCAPTY